MQAKQQRIEESLQSVPQGDEFHATVEVSSRKVEIFLPISVCVASL